MTSVDTHRPTATLPASQADTDPATAADGRAPLPRHIAIVMDGNRRWARLHGLSEAEGHSAGVDAIRPIVEHCADLGIEALSIYAFSRENWSRDESEVHTLFALLEAAIRRETPDLVRQGVRVRILGRLEELPDQTRASIADALSATAGGHRMTLNVAFNYSGRSEIVDAVHRAIADGLRPDEIDEEQISTHLYTADGPDLDLLIRTGGEQRISNFLIWQAAYAELYFSDVLWPDFAPTTLDAALAEFARRTRRFGR
jgi:undecaprenyl diphosphate synthase